jgi:glutathione S-transferase
MPSLSSNAPRKITLYISPGACSLAPHIILHELSLPQGFSNISVDARAGLTEQFAAINPKLRVPVLVLEYEDEGEEGHEMKREVITEVPAIMTALSMLKPELKLLGGSDMEVVRSYEWMNWLSGWVHGVGFGCLWRSHRYSEDEIAIAGIRKKGKKTVEEAFEMIEERLAGRKSEGGWPVGEAFSVVDANLFVFWRWGGEVGLDMESRFPNYAELMKRVLEREAVKKALRAEGIES